MFSENFSQINFFTIKIFFFLEGHILFKATCEGQSTKPQHPDHYISFEDESHSSERTLAPLVERSKTSATYSSSSTAGTSKNLNPLEVNTSNEVLESLNPNCVRITNCQSINKIITEINSSSNESSTDINQELKLKLSDQEFDDSTVPNIVRRAKTEDRVLQFEPKNSEQIAPQVNNCSFYFNTVFPHV